MEKEIILDRPSFATNVFDEYQEPEPIRSELDIWKQNWLWFRIGAGIFLIGVAFNYFTLRSPT